MKERRRRRDQFTFTIPWIDGREGEEETFSLPRGVRRKRRVLACYMDKKKQRG